MDLIEFIAGLKEFEVLCKAGYIVSPVKDSFDIVIKRAKLVCNEQYSEGEFIELTSNIDDLDRLINEGSQGNIEFDDEPTVGIEIIHSLELDSYGNILYEHTILFRVSEWSCDDAIKQSIISKYIREQISREV